ncbi:MAG: serine hydrolase domain-containing protein [Rhizomicrobium sp.]
MIGFANIDVNGPEWKLYCASGVAQSDFGAGQFEAALQIGTGRQTLALGPVFILAARTAADRKVISAGCPALTAAFAHVPIAPPSIEELKKKIEKIMADTHTPGVSVAIVRKNGPEWIAGLGKADVASNRPATADTLFRIGSVSKTFVSLAILKLANEGKLSLQDPVHKLVPEVWFENRWEATDPVRVVDLLEHTTGWDDEHMREFVKDGSHMNLRDQFDYDHHSRISRWRPGTRMAYCNSGPAVAAYIVEKITGRRFEDYIALNFFAPLGMKTATYFQPAPQSSVTLYHSDGTRPFPYWNLIYRPPGAINASANDMARLLSLYLNRGNVGGVQIMPADSIARTEFPTRTWAARNGLKIGYGLGIGAGIFDNSGLVYSGHAGGVPGGLTDMIYLPNDGVGYFYSINTGNDGAKWLIGKAIRDYITLGLWTKPMPKPVPPPANAESFAGWYEPVSPRHEYLRFSDRLMGMAWVHIKDGKLLLTSLQGRDQPYIPVSGALLRPESVPFATLALIAPNADGQFIQRDDGVTLKRLPTWFALGELILCAFVALTMVSIVLYAPCWMLRGLSKKHRRPDERWIKIWPLIATLSFIMVIAVLSTALGDEDVIEHLGNLTLRSGGLWLGTIIFAGASIAAAVALWRARNSQVRKWVFVHATAVTLALLIATAYLAYWGVIGIRTWA